MNNPLVKVSGLTKSFFIDQERIDVIKGIDLEIFKQDVISIVGISGVGKSTFLHILGTIDEPTQGRIIFEGQDVFNLPRNKIAAFRNEKIGFVFQFHHLLPEFTAMENTMMPALIQRLSRSEAMEQASQLLEEVGLADRMKHKPGELSGGEQQRVAIARSLILKPKLLLADEPTGNLDRETGEEVHNLLIDLNKRFGVTMIVVTHNEQLAGLMPRRLRMSDGLIFEETAAESATEA